MYFALAGIIQAHSRARLYNASVTLTYKGHKIIISSVAEGNRVVTGIAYLLLLEF